MNKEGMTARELIKYAKDNDCYNSLKFVCRKDGALLFVGEFLDAYYEFIKIPVVGEGIVRLSDIEEKIGYGLLFDELDEEQFLTYVRMDYILHGKQIPEKYAFKEGE